MSTEQTIEAEEALRQLAAQVPPPKPKLPPDRYEFIAIGEQIAASLIKAADEQVEEAHKLRDRVMELAGNIGVELEAHAKTLNDMNERTRAFGQVVVDAHNKYLLNNGKHENPSP